MQSLIHTYTYTLHTNTQHTYCLLTQFDKETNQIKSNPTTTFKWKINHAILFSIIRLSNVFITLLINMNIFHNYLLLWICSVWFCFGFVLFFVYLMASSGFFFFFVYGIIILIEHILFYKANNFTKVANIDFLISGILIVKSTTKLILCASR